MSPTPTRAYEVSARIVGPGVAEAQANQATIAYDSSPELGGELPGSAELLCAAFAACLLKNVERFSQMLPFEQRGASVRVTAEREQSPPRFAGIRYELRVVTDEPRTASSYCGATSRSTAPSTTRSPSGANRPPPARRPGDTPDSGPFSSGPGWTNVAPSRPCASARSA